MKAYIFWNHTTITAPTLRELRTQMRNMLHVAGPRGLTAKVNTRAEIHVELYDGLDWMTDKNGRFIKL